MLVLDALKGFLPVYAGRRWLANPLSRTLEVYVRENGCWTLVGTFAGHVKVRAVPFDTAEIDLGLLWPE